MEVQELQTRRELAMQAKEQARAFQAEITRSWKEIAQKYPEVIEDFESYCLGLAETYRYWAEEQKMGNLPIDDHKVSQLLQTARTCDIVRTYITSRIDSNVAQPIKN